MEVRQLTEEVFALRRARALAEKKEVEVRSELGNIREQVCGVRCGSGVNVSDGTFVKAELWSSDFKALFRL